MGVIKKGRKEQGYRKLSIRKKRFRELYPLEKVGVNEKVYIYVNPYNKQVEIDIRKNILGQIKNKIKKKKLTKRKKYLWDRKDYDKLIIAERETIIYQLIKRRYMKEANTRGINSEVTISCKCGNPLFFGEPIDIFELITGDGDKDKEQIKIKLYLNCSECGVKVNYEGLEEGSKEMVGKVLDFFIR